MSKRKTYPTGGQLRPSWFRLYPSNLIALDTPITSMGSCFARHVGLWLSKSGYNFLTPDRGRWDRMYSSHLIRQEIERAYGEFTPEEMYWEGRKLRDPYRQGISWVDEDEAEKALSLYAAECRRVLDLSKVLIVTIGVNEIWFNEADDAVFFQRPPELKEHHGFRCATVEENVANLERILELYRGTMIVTVSPIPLLQTFALGNVIENSLESKATLLLAAKQFARTNERVHYFPSYEIVTTTPYPFLEDNRHLKAEVVEAVMGVFENNLGAVA